MARICWLLLLLTVLGAPGWARGGGGCFLAGSMTLLGDGTEIPIEQVKKGDRVWSLDGDRVVRSVVTNTYSRTVEGYYALTVGSLVILATGEHPFALADGTFRTVDSLRPGDALRSWNLGKLGIVNLDSLEYRTGEVVVYNLEVAGPHTYFVSGIAVHNKGGFGGGGHFGGGVHFGGAGGHYYGSGGGTVDDGTLVWFAFFILVVVGLLVVSKPRDREASPARSNQGNLDFKVDPIRAGQKHRQALAVLQDLATREKEFEPRALQEQFQEVFRLLQKCWTLRDYGQLEGFLTTNLANQHRKQLEGLRRAHEINQLDPLEIQGFWFFQVVFTTKDTSEITVLFQAKVRDYYVDDRDGRILRGDSSAETFQEFWVFRWSGHGWLLASIHQVTEESRAWKANRIEKEALLKSDFASIAPQAQAEEKLKQLAGVDPLWAPGPLREQISLWCAQMASARESATLDGMQKSDFADAVWERLQSEIEGRKARGETVLLRNFCVRDVAFVLVRARKQGANEVLARVSTHALAEVRRDGQVVSLDSDIRIQDENWLVAMEGACWTVCSIDTVS